MTKTSPGTLYLIPLPIASETHDQVLPAYNTTILQQITHFLVEDERTARRFIKKVGHPIALEDIQILPFNKHSPLQDLETCIKPLLSGHDMGILSEAGCPGIADPGAVVVHYAHQQNIPVIPLVGPCSILLALMASGFSGQNFAFHGYLPINKEACQQAIKQLEMHALQNKQTQIFIETPYRNEAMLETLLATCNPQTWLCIGKNITSSDGWIQSHTIKDWKNNKPYLKKIPVVFLLSSFKV
jgi:16S rRNA (cytidine1402-2'-O)-methyltransferase